MGNELLLNSEQHIKSAYAELSHNQGWSFLYTPANTLTSNSRFLFMGLNPGGTGKNDAAELTTEAGNAYNPEVEDWGGDGQGNPLQSQIVLFYKMLSERTGHDYRKMMNSTLAANFCPFRSQSWADLKEQKKTIIFCTELWSNLIKNTQISTIVCMSSLVRHHISSIIVSADGRMINHVSKSVGWGNVSYSTTKFVMEGRDIIMICLPHLSRYKIFGRTGSYSQVEEITNLVAGSLTDWTP